MENLKHISKFLSLVLRHKPETIGIQLDSNGWVDVTELLTKMNQHRHTLDVKTLWQVVETNDKRRFAFSEDGSKIRASQGHSVEVDLALEAKEPPAILYHGTVPAVLQQITSEGLKKMSRQHVHLSKDVETALKVGGRRGKPVILKVRAQEMVKDGHLFYLSANGVWLCDAVPPNYIEMEL
ncbi:MAG: RNA 2'-phosphotransferase [Sediminibacterium sp.]|nr:RNA 2'-phosphotransferase [Sediminibacterium sp.]